MNEHLRPPRDVDALLDQWAEVSASSRPPALDRVRRPRGHGLHAALATGTAAIAVLALVSVVLVLQSSPAARPALPEPTPSAVTAEAVSHPFRLVFEMPTATWRAGQPIEGMARLELVEGERVTYSGSGSGPLAFVFVEVNGDREMTPVWTADCQAFELEAREPVVAGITKSGRLGADDSNADFYRDFFADPEVRLPAGEWDISAVGLFHEGPVCGGRERQPRATIRVTIEP
jgi:hypothetical protein